MNWQRWVLIALMLTGFILSWLLLKPEILGFIYDDAVYLLAAKSLAYGQGYFLHSTSPAIPIVKYPPLFPLLLAPLWWFFPHFPENIIAFKLVPVICLLGVLYILYREGVRQNPNKTWFALIPVGLLALDSSVSFVSSSLLSETFFMMLSLGVLFWLGRQDPLNPKQFPSHFKIAVFSVLPYYTRSIGITLILAIFIWLWQQRSFKYALQYLTWSALLLSPWLAWSILQAPPVLHWENTFLVDYNHSYMLDLGINYQRLGGFWPWLWDGLQALSLVTVNRLFRLLPHLPLNDGVSSILQNILAGGLCIGFTSWALKSRTNKWSLSSLYFIFYLIALLLWSTDKLQYWRLLIPVFPLFWLALLQGFKPAKKVQNVFIILFLLQFMTGSLLYAINLINNRFSNQMALNTPHLWQEYQNTFKFMSSLPKDAKLLTPYNHAYFLYTHRPTWCLNAYSFNQSQTGSYRQHFQKVYSHLMHLNHVNYVIVEPAIGYSTIVSTTAMPLVNELITNQPEKFSLIYQSRSKSIKIYHFNG